MNKNFDTYRPAIEAAIEASEAIMKIYAGSFEASHKEDGSPVTIADLQSSDIIERHLKETNIPIIGEELEESEYSERCQWTKVWCVDPLDGTKEFLKKNGEFVINIALIDKCKPIFGLIASPIRREIIIGGKGLGAYQFSYEDAFNMEKWEKIEKLSSMNSPVHIISSRSHYSGNFLNLAKQIEEEFGEIQPLKMGSALKFFELVNNRADVYPRLAPTMEWDIAAGQAIYEAVGGEIVNVETGKPLVYNKEDLTNPYFVASKKTMKLKMDFYHS